MNFLGVGPLELVVILVVALVFVGPERLPKLAADIARTIREIRKYTSSIAAEFTDVLQEFEKETEPEKSQWKEIGQGLTDATKSVTDAFREAQAAAAAPAPTNGATPSPLTPPSEASLPAEPATDANGTPHPAAAAADSVSMEAPPDALAGPAPTTDPTKPANGALPAAEPAHEPA
jgi:sec-independent protein translocase protein TatB